MFTESRKIHLLEEVLKTTNEATLIELEVLLKKSKSKEKATSKKASIYDFVGMLTKKESAAMKKAISDTCETINTDGRK